MRLRILLLLLLLLPRLHGLVYAQSQPAALRPVAADTAHRCITAVAVITPGEVKRYDKFEVGLTLNRSFTANGLDANPYDPEDVSVEGTFTGPSGRVLPVRYGFYYKRFVIRNQYLLANNPRYWDGSAPTLHPWRVRFAPDEAGLWQYVLRVTYRDGTTETLAPRTFTCVSSTNPGFLKVAPNHRNLIFDQGKSFFAIGSNVDYWSDIPIRVPAALGTPSGPALNRCGPTGPVTLSPPKSAQYKFSTYTYAAYNQVFQELHANGGNFARVWFHEYNFDFEPDGASLGYYEAHQNMLYDFDRLLAAAKAQGVYLHLSLLDGIRLKELGGTTNWSRFAYKTGLNLNDTLPLEFFTDARARQLFKNRIRYVVARWGYSPNVASYELINEGDFVNNGTVFLNNFQARMPQLVDWTVEMATYLKELDQRHLQTLSYGPENASRLLEEHPELFDYSTSHYYSSSFNTELQRNYATQVQTRVHGRPYQMQEYDYAPYVNTEYQSKFHTPHWATAFSGSFGIALPLSAFANIHHPCWPAYAHYRPLARFLAAARFSSAADNVPIGNSAAAALELYGRSYLPKLARDRTFLAKIPVVADSSYNPSYYSPCERECPVGWPQSLGVAPQYPITARDSAYYNQPDYLVSGLTVRDKRTGSTRNNALIEVFALQNDTRIMGWVHNKTHYWYNLPHSNANVCDPRTDPNCASEKCTTCDNNPALANAPISGRPGPNTITPLRGQQLVVTGLKCPGTYRVRWFYTQPGRDVDQNGVLDDGGFLTGLEQAAVSAIDGQLIIAIPPLVALGADGPTTGPDYAFIISSNDECAPVTP